MNLPVIVRARAERDIRSIFDWYEARQAGLGERFIENLREAIAGVRSRSRLDPSIYRNVRRTIVAKFPYAVFYVAEPGRIVVLAVLHTSRDPAVWPRR